jgi:hypothetical protein
LLAEEVLGETIIMVPAAVLESSKPTSPVEELVELPIPMQL